MTIHSHRTDTMLRLLVLVLLATALAGCAGTAPVEEAPVDDGSYWADLAEAVRQEYRHAWRGYTAYAWGHDELRPLSRSFRDWYEAPLRATAVDALDGLLLLGLEEEAIEARGYLVQHLSFDRDVYVNTYEVTTRLLGGLLAAHEMTGDARLLALAEDLGRRLLPAFASPTGMPYRFVNLRSGAVRDPVNSTAAVGGLLLEMGTLSALTGDPVFEARARRALEAVYARRSSVDLAGASLNVETGAWLDGASHVGGGIGSYYETLLKAGLLFGDASLTSMWQVHRDALHAHLATTADSALWYGRVDMHTGAATAPHYGARHASFPAVLVLDGDLRRADSLHASGMQMWNLHGLAPELLDFDAMEVVSPAYRLRPGLAESTYHLFRATGDDAYRRMGEALFDDLVRYTRASGGYAAVADVRTMQQDDAMPSPFLSETLKYLYLLFAPDDAPGLDEAVMTTAGHPLRRRR